MEKNVTVESANGVQNKPVPLCAAGKGLPYAPVDWPEHGDVWTWKVGNKVTATGFFVHRSLIVPKRLQKTPTRKIWLGSKNAVIQFLKTEFPDADVDAFFASFTWEILADVGSAQEGTGTVKNNSVIKKPEPAPKKEPPPSKSPTLKKSSLPVKNATPTKSSTSKNEAELETPIGKRTRKSASSNQEFIPKSEPESGSQAAKRSRNSVNSNQVSMHKQESIPQKEQESGSLALRRTTRNSTRKQLSIQDAAISTDPTSPENQTGLVNAHENNHEHDHAVAADPGKESTSTPSRRASSRRKRKTSNSRPNNVAEMSSEDFDNYLNSLDDIISQPPPKAPTPTLTFESYLLQTDEDFARARQELSSLLSQDLSSLITSERLPIITDLSSKLRSDPDLTLEELSILDLILEIPMVSDDLAKANRVKMEASKFFGDLETNIALVTKLRNKYTLSKDKIAVLQAENEANNPTIQELDEQIAKLQSRRDELAKSVDENEVQITELSCTQKRILNSLPKIVNEVKSANAEKNEWEVKQEEGTKQEEQILAKFALLEGFSFTH